MTKYEYFMAFDVNFSVEIWRGWAFNQLVNSGLM